MFIPQLINMIDNTMLQKIKKNIISKFIKNLKFRLMVAKILIATNKFLQVTNSSRLQFNPHSGTISILDYKGRS